MSTENTHPATSSEPTTTTGSSVIDETPLSVQARRQSIEKHLQTRPDPKDLKDRNILLNTNAAPSLQSTALDLERQLHADNLKKGLGKRPEREELVERNILPLSTAAPALQGQQRKLERHMRADSLEQGLKQRPKPEDLVREGILMEGDDPTSPVEK
ncbi:MAG: hypothetical protein MMC33_008502 [Icmadophila ericetorum]|nr:hypothetical protein [Icmadophila ericetorum]